MLGHAIIPVMKKIYLAPLEGITDYVYRNTFCNYYGGVDKYYTPFLSPNSTHKFTTKEINNIDPNKNDVDTLVPQLLSNNAEHFLWAIKEISKLGFGEINLNLGCPSGTVVAKRKGSGLLFYPELLDQVLYEIFDGVGSLKNKPAISVKTRLGKNEPEEFYEILDIYNKYPIYELTIHPRIQTDFYNGSVRMDFFEYAVAKCNIPIVYNGDITSSAAALTIENKYPAINAIMIGRGLISNPTLAATIKSEATSVKETEFNKAAFWDFHDELLDQYQELLSGETPLLHRLKEFWQFWQINFPNEAKTIKKIHKCKKLVEYQSAISPLRN